MATQHLKQKLKESGIKPGVIKEVNSIMKNIHSKINEKLGKMILPQPIGSLADLTEKNLQKMGKADIEANIRAAKLREAQRLKKQLEQKLKFVENNIGAIQDSEKRSFNRQSFKDEQSRSKYYEELKEIEEQRRVEVRNYMKDQKMREKKRKQLAKEMELKQQEDQEEALRLQQELQQKKEEEKAERLRILEEKKNQREEEMRIRKETTDKAYQEVKSKKPFYVIKEEEDMKKQEREEKRRKELIAKKRVEYYKPIDNAELQEHAKQFDTLKKEQEARLEKERKNKLLEVQLHGASQSYSTYNQALISEKRLKEEKQRAAKERLDLIKKRARYGELVKEMFAPSIDKAKKREIEMRKDRLQHPIKPRVRSGGRTRQKNIDLGLDQGQKPFRPKKFKENPMVPKPEKKREGKIEDYLSQMKLKRGENGAKSVPNNLEWQKEIDKIKDPVQRAAKIKEKAELLERQAQRKEALISNRVSIRGVDESKEVGEMYLSSIKAKLALLDQLSPS